MPTAAATGSPELEGLRWLMPGGTLGDALVLSSVLRLGHELTGERFAVVRGPPFTGLFLDHPAVAHVGSAPPGVRPILMVPHRLGSSVPPGFRAFATFARALFGAALPEKPPWAPLRDCDFQALADLPVGDSPILLAPEASSVRRKWPNESWAELARMLGGRVDVPIAQVGLRAAPGIPRTLNLTGKLTPRQLLALIHRACACVSVDPFVAAGAKMAEVPTIALFGPTMPEHEGFDGQIQVARLGRCAGGCLDGSSDDEKAPPCPQRKYCVAEIAASTVAGVFDAHVAPVLGAGSAAQLQPKARTAEREPAREVDGRKSLAGHP